MQWELLNAHGATWDTNGLNEMAPLAGGPPDEVPSSGSGAEASVVRAKHRGFRVVEEVALGAVSVRITVELDSFPAPRSNPNVRRPAFLRQKRRR